MKSYPSERPTWTVLYNILSPESRRWIGTGWEFFYSDSEAEECYIRHIKNGNCPTKRRYHTSDRSHLGAAHNMKDGKLVV